MSSRCLPVAIVCIAAGLLGQASAVQAQGDRIFSGPGGITVVVANAETALRQPSASKAPAFRPLSASMRAAVAEAAGLPLASADAAFTLTPHQPWVEGRGWLTFANAALLDAEGNVAGLGAGGAAGGIQVTVAVGAATTYIMLHFQVSSPATVPHNYHIVSQLGGTEYAIPAIPGEAVQDVVAFVPLHKGAPGYYTFRFRSDTAETFRLLGVEVTPM